MRHYYRDSFGRFTSRDGQLANVAAAIHAKDWDLYQAERAVLNEVDALRGFVEPTAPKNGAPAAVASIDDEIAHRDKLIASGTRPELESFLDERVNRPEFIELLEIRDETRNRAKELKAEYDFLVQQADRHPELDYEVVRLKGKELLETYESLQILKQQAEDYKDATAPAVARISELLEEEQRQNGTFREYTEDELNNLRKTGDFESGSREWLENRQNGIGGSDVGKIIGAYGGKYAARDYEDVLLSKIDPISDEQVAEQEAGHSAFVGATGRGNAWEEAILTRFAENNPNANVTHCKSSWENADHPEQRINFDGLMTDENGQPNGIVEIKTGSDASKWGQESEGIDGIPSGYRAQVLHYMYNGGLKKGALAVMLDDREYREYHFDLTPELEAEAKSNFEKTQAFYEEVQARRAGTYTAPLPTRRNTTGFSQDVLNSGISGKKNVIFEEAAAYRDTDVESVRARYQEIISKEDRKDPEKVKAALIQLYTEHDPRTNKSPVIAIDLETSGSQPTTGRILEVGISVRNPGGGEQSKFSKLYGLSKKSMAATSTGPVEVHQITPGMIAKKARFEQVENQKQLLEVLKSGTIMAHNLPFEKRWLRLHLDGFAEAERNGELRFLDTMRLSQRLVPETKDNTLQSFTEHFNREYKNAHRAYNDAVMMAESYEDMSVELNRKFKNEQ